MNQYLRGALLTVLCLATAAATVHATGTRELASDEEAVEVGPENAAVTLIENGRRIEEVARYATGFQAYRNGRFTIIEVTRPWQGAGPADALRYVLYPREDSAPEVSGADLVLGVPVESIVTMSTTFLPHLAAIDAKDSLAAVDSVAYAYSEWVHERHRANGLIQVGSGPNVDVEQLLVLDPDVVMVNSYGGDWDAQPVLEEAGLPVVVSGDWVEHAPLGRAEWLLFTSMFFGELESALEVFNEIEQEYLRLAALASEAMETPTVLSNAPYQGTWSVPGGESYAARFIADASGDYVWSDTETTGAIHLDVETVYAEAGDADVWINPGAWTSLEAGAAEDERFASFKAFRTGRVYSNNLRIGPGGGNDYFESGALNPHIILNDLIWVLHRDLVPDYEPFYYQRLQ
ncbi:MAG: ABC transporter substrate-binding protein [Spirochaetota bacterium]